MSCNSIKMTKKYDLNQFIVNYFTLNIRFFLLKDKIVENTTIF